MYKTYVYGQRRGEKKIKERVYMALVPETKKVSESPEVCVAVCSAPDTE